MVDDFFISINRKHMVDDFFIFIQTTSVFNISLIHITGVLCRFNISMH